VQGLRVLVHSQSVVQHVCEAVMNLFFLFVGCTLCCATMPLKKILYPTISCSHPCLAIRAQDMSIIIHHKHLWYDLSKYVDHLIVLSHTSSSISHCLSHPIHCFGACLANWGLLCCSQAQYHVTSKKKLAAGTN